MTSEGDLIKKLEIKMEMLGPIKNWYPEGFTQKQDEGTGKATLIENKLDELQELKRNVQEQMLENEKSEEVKAWGYEMKTKF